MNLVIELLNREKDFITNLKSSKNADAQELQMLAEIDQALQLLQTTVISIPLNTIFNNLKLHKNEQRKIFQKE